ncbi:hypothetical protein E2553_37810 [Paraburkholderia dipogonis]|uniref:Uncharacterized protein n=1 Tax=Paraburkholderia dipogonis TaxID=1211383 RepID=A0A4Y8ML07_9BURK|nr:hypothetical protein [Paraburkholderia dipogonis]TFE38139.1 hypothetical protein E2553_37810 [Paraburkholderia dipogonis]
MTSAMGLLAATSLLYGTEGALRALVLVGVWSSSRKNRGLDGWKQKSPKIAVRGLPGGKLVEIAHMLPKTTIF